MITLETDLPSRDILMKNTCNRIQLINVICEANTPRTLRMLGPDPYIYKHEEANNTSIRYLNMFIQEVKKSIQVVANDTDIFILLVY